MARKRRGSVEAPKLRSLQTLSTEVAAVNKDLRQDFQDWREKRRGKREKMSSEDLAEQRGLQRAAGSYRRKHRQHQLNRKKTRQKLRQYARN